MKLKKKVKHKDGSCIDRYSVPMSVQMKTTLDKLKEESQIDVNGMARDFFDSLIRQSQELTG